ncbi:hypothetical protein D6783_02430 [Candidatus Woesearchaeota archaeon]|nr:MAG: hypothetical protein D6783_02430 [Candidatus Woesearchaeota archaeon]
MDYETIRDVVVQYWREAERVSGATLQASFLSELVEKDCSANDSFRSMSGQPHSSAWKHLLCYQGGLWTSPSNGERLCTEAYLSVVAREAEQARNRGREVFPDLTLGGQSVSPLELRSICLSWVNALRRAGSRE